VRIFCDPSSTPFRNCPFSASMFFFAVLLAPLEIRFQTRLCTTFVRPLTCGASAVFRGAENFQFGQSHTPLSAYSCDPPSLSLGFLFYRDSPARRSRTLFVFVPLALPEPGGPRKEAPNCNPVFRSFKIPIDFPMPPPLASEFVILPYIFTASSARTEEMGWRAVVLQRGAFL